MNRVFLYILLYPLRYIEAYGNWAHKMRAEKRSHMLIKKEISEQILKEKPLSDQRKDQIKSFYGKYGIRVNPRWHEACYALNDIDSNKYISEFLFYEHIEPHFNNMKMIRAFNDKNLYSRHFPEASQPKTILRFISGQLFDELYRKIDKETAVDLIRELSEPAIVKPSLQSGGGKNVNILRGNGESILLNEQPVTFDDILDFYRSGFIIQERVKQYKSLSALNPHSLNTVKFVVFRFEKKIHVLSALLRTAADENHVDNVIKGGMFCGVKSDGFLHDEAFDRSYRRHTKHPLTKTEFGSTKIPNFEKITETVCDIHKDNFYSDIASWDIGINSKGEPVLIEINLKNQDILLHQIVGGPLFGDLTETVLNDVFSKNS